MKKKQLTLLVSLAVVIALSLTAVLLSATQPDDGETDSDTTSDSGITIISTDAVVESIQVENKSGAFTIEPDENVLEVSSEEESDSISGEEDTRQWKIKELGSVTQYQSMYSDLAMLMTDLTADAELNEPQELSVYGLDSPQAKATANYDDGTSLTLLVGNLTPDETGYYCMVDGNDTIYILSSTNGEKFTWGILNYVDLQVTPTIETVTYTTESSEEETVTSSTLNIESITIQKRDESDVMITAANNLLVKDEVELNEDISTTLQSAMSNITATAAVTVAPTQNQLESYGLTDPSARVSYTVSGKTYTLMIGNGIEIETDESATVQVGGIGSYYVMAEGTDVIFEVAADYLPWMDLDFD